MLGLERGVFGTRADVRLLFRRKGRLKSRPRTAVRGVRFEVEKHRRTAIVLLTSI